MDPERVAGFEARHRAQHEKEDRRDRMAQRGHVIEVFPVDSTCDETTARAICSCEWKSSVVKSCNIDDVVDRHLVEIEAIMASWA